VQPFGEVPAHRIIRWSEHDHRAARAHHSVHLRECPVGFDNVLDHVGTQNDVDRARSQRKICVEVQQNRFRTRELCGGEQYRVVVRCNREVMITLRPGEDRTRAAPEVDDRCAGLESGQLALNNVDLSVVNPAKKVLIFWTAVIV